MTSGLPVYSKIISEHELSIYRALEPHNPGKHRIITPLFPIQRLGESDLYMVVTPDYGDCFCPRSDEGIIRMSLELCQALSFLHSRRIAHLDIKLPNIALDHTTETLTLIDLGGAMQLPVPEGTEPLIEGASGTCDFVPPEVQQWYTDPAIARPYNPFKADVWGAGSIIAIMSGFIGDTPTSVMVDRFGTWMKETRPPIDVATQQARWLLEEWQPTTRAVKDEALGRVSYPINMSITTR